MRFATTLLAGLMLAVLSFSTGQGQDKPRQAVKPGRIVPVRGKFQLQVQQKPRFPKEKRPAASKPATVNGLTLTVQPEKQEFAGNGPLAFEVVLKNTSKRTFTLPAVDTLGGKPRLVVSNQKTAVQWSLPGKLKRGDGKVLNPGKSATYYVVVESRFVFPRPGPVPLPRPIPRRRIQPGKGNVKGGKGVVIRRRPPIIARPNLPCGQGPCNAKLFLEFEKPEGAQNKAAPPWAGKIASATFSFKVGKPDVWKPGTPLDKKRAIQVAHPVAERALSGHYKPIAGIRPAKQGNWIGSPHKSATAKKDKNGNWKVSWTAFPKKGHSYNVTVAVNRFGGASAVEVFTGYSRGR